jgi:hypothetical protein
VTLLNRPLTLDTDVRAVAHEFGIDPDLLQSVVNAEDGDIAGAVREAVPSVTTRVGALRVAARSAVHAMSDYIKHGGTDRRDAFIMYWGRRWDWGAVPAADHLDECWVENVYRLWLHL